MSPDVAIDEIRPTVEVLARRFAAQAPSHITVDTRDLEQDAYLACLQALGRYNGSTKISTFLRLRVHGSMVDGLRRWDHRPRRHLGPRRVIWEPLPDRADERWTADSVDPLTTFEHRDVRRAFHRLDARSRYILRRSIVDGAPLDQIGRELGLQKAWLSRLRAAALTQLKEILSWPTPTTAQRATGISPRTASTVRRPA